MGKKERQAEKLVQRADVEIKNRLSMSSKSVLGFKAGWCWGKAGLGMALRRPIYFGLGHILLLSTIALIAWVGTVAGGDSNWSYAATIAGIFAITSGIACCGSAARAQALWGGNRQAAWSAWITPLHGDWHVVAGTMARCTVGLMFLLLISAVIQWIQAVRGGGSVEWLVKSWESRLLSMATIYILGLWLLVMAMPNWGIKKMAKALWLLAMSPLSLLGFGVFWMIWVAVSELVFIYAINQIMNQIMMEQTSFAQARESLMGLIVLVIAGMSMPAMAMSAGLASLALETDMARKAKADEMEKVAVDGVGPNPG